MTEHDHMLPIGFYTSRWLSKDRIRVNMPECEYVLRRADAEKLVDEFEDVLDGPGPQIVCEVVERRL